MAEPSGASRPSDTELALHTPGNAGSAWRHTRRAPPTATTPRCRPQTSHHLQRVLVLPRRLPLQRTALPAEASAPPTSRPPAELTLNEPAVSRPGRKPQQDARATRLPAGRGRIDRVPNRPHLLLALRQHRHRPLPYRARHLRRPRPPKREAHRFKGLLRAGASGMPDLTWRCFKPRIRRPCTRSPGATRLRWRAPAASPSVQRRAGSPAGGPRPRAATTARTSSGGAAGSPDGAITRGG
jgi:hypothetical protein